MFHSSMAFGLEKGMRRCAGVKKLSTSVGHKNELRRLSSVGYHVLLVAPLRRLRANARDSE
jgi:hypothetical protein